MIRNRDVKVTTWDHVEKDNENVHNEGDEGDDNTSFQENDELEQMESQSPTSHVLPGVETTDTYFIDNNYNENSSDISDYYYENSDTELEKNYEREDYRTIRGRTTKKPVSYAMLMYEGSNVSEEVSLEPKTFDEATKLPEKVQCSDAMRDELKNLTNQGTWEVTTLPKGRKAVGCKWIYKAKKDENGVITRFKARLVAKGFNQVEGIDFKETYSPVVSYSTLRLVLAISAMRIKINTLRLRKCLS